MMVATYSDVVKANTETSGVKRGPYSSGFTDFLSMKVLAAKRVDRFGSVYGANAFPMSFTQKKDLVRNLGIRIDTIRLAELDALTEMLGCNKQEFVLEVLVAGIEQAKEALEKAELQKSYEEKINQKVLEAGFTVEPAQTEGYWTLHYKGELIVNKEYESHQSAARAMSDAVTRATSESKNTEPV